MPSVIPKYTLWHSNFWQNQAKITIAQKFANKNCVFCDDQIEILHDVKELAKSGVPYIRSLDITGGTYFRNDFTPLWSAEKDVWNR